MNSKKKRVSIWEEIIFSSHSISLYLYNGSICSSQFPCFCCTPLCAWLPLFKELHSTILVGQSIRSFDSSTIFVRDSAFYAAPSIKLLRLHLHLAITSLPLIPALCLAAHTFEKRFSKFTLISKFPTGFSAIIKSSHQIVQEIQNWLSLSDKWRNQEAKTIFRI